MYVYVKKQHVGVVPGLDKFAAEYVSAEGASVRMAISPRRAW